MPWKIDYYSYLHLSFLPENLGAVIDEKGERFYQNFNISISGIGTGYRIEEI